MMLFFKGSLTKVVPGNFLSTLCSSRRISVNFVSTLCSSQSKEIVKYTSQSITLLKIFNEQENTIIQLRKESDSMQKSNIKLLEDTKFYKGLCEKYVVELKKQQHLYNDLKSATDIEHQEYLNLQEEIQQLKEKLDKISNELNDKNISLTTLNSQEQYLYEELKRKKYLYEQSESAWKNEKKNLEESSLKLVKCFKELENENKILHEYISNKSSKNDQLISNLRQEKEVFSKQAKKYKVQLIQTQKSLNEVRLLFNKEHEFNKKIQIESAELNAKNKYINESNRISREECKKMEKVVTAFQSSKNEFEEKISNLKGQIQDLKFEKDNGIQEMNIIQKENEQLKERLRKYEIDDSAELQKLKLNTKYLESEIERLNMENKIQFNDIIDSANKFKNENDALEIKNNQIENKKLRLIEENLKLENEIQKIQNWLVYYLDLQANHDKELEQLKEQLENSRQNKEITKNLIQKQKDDLMNELKEVKDQLEVTKKELKNEKELMVEFEQLKAQESTYISTVKKLETENQDLQQKLKFSLENSTSQSSSTQDKQTPSKPDLPEPVSGKKHSHDEDDKEMVSKAKRIREK